MGKSTISVAIFNSYVTNYQRVMIQKKEEIVMLVTKEIEAIREILVTKILW